MAHPDLFLCGRNLSNIPAVKGVASSIVPNSFIIGLDDLFKISFLKQSSVKNLENVKFIPGMGWVNDLNGNFTKLNLDVISLPVSADQNCFASNISQFKSLIADFTRPKNLETIGLNLIFVGLLSLASNAKRAGLDVVFLDVGNNSQKELEKQAAGNVDIHIDNPRSQNFLVKEILNELTTWHQMIKTQEELRELIDRNEVKISKYDLHGNWPHHPMMMDLRKRITPIVNKVVQTHPLIDPQDLIHQVLFRLTTYSPRDIYNNLLMGKLKNDGVLEKPEKISRLDPNFLQKQLINWELINSTVEEQTTLAKKRNSGKGSIYNYFRKKDIFSSDEEKRWCLHSRNGQLFVKSPFGGERNVVFEIVNSQLAHSITGQHHYIHATRSRGYSFGLRIEDEEIPFAIETVESTTEAREVKQKAWLAKGFHPLRGFELTRLYTFPGGPKNVIGILDRLVPEALLKIFPLTEFVSTTVMPTYALTRSTTIAAGIDEVVLARTRPHKFISHNVNGVICLEQITNRKLDGISNNEVFESHPEFPLLPALEVVKAINKKSFAPILNEGEAIFIDER